MKLVDVMCSVCGKREMLVDSFVRFGEDVQCECGSPAVVECSCPGKIVMGKFGGDALRDYSRG